MLKEAALPAASFFISGARVHCCFSAGLAQKVLYLYAIEECPLTAAGILNSSERIPRCSEVV
jgi:hypothetical protein